jgi:hypothetical protein
MINPPFAFTSLEESAVPPFKTLLSLSTGIVADLCWRQIFILVVMAPMGIISSIVTLAFDMYDCAEVHNSAC